MGSASFVRGRRPGSVPGATRRLCPTPGAWVYCWHPSRPGASARSRPPRGPARCCLTSRSMHFQKKSRLSHLHTRPLHQLLSLCEAPPGHCLLTAPWQGFLGCLLLQEGIPDLPGLPVLTAWSVSAVEALSRRYGARAGRTAGIVHRHPRAHEVPV